MFQVVARHCKLIFCLLTSPKLDLVSSRSRCFNESTGTEKSYFAFREVQNAIWAKSWKPCFKGSSWPWWTFFAFWVARNATLARPRKRDFMGSQGPANLISASWTAQNETLVCWRMRRFKGSTGPEISLFCFLCCSKCNLSEVVKAMFQVATSFVFSLFSFRDSKCDFFEFEKAMI